MSAIGERIASTLDAMRQRGFTVQHLVRVDDDVYRVVGSSYHVEVTVNPARWVGLHLGIGPADHRATLTYDIDTVLHDLAHPRFDSFARAVEGDIVAFLDALAAGQIKVGRIGRQTAMLVPSGKRMLLVTRGRFGRSTRVRRVSGAVESRGGFVALH